jgi:hypothetical protein
VSAAAASHLRFAPIENPGLPATIWLCALALLVLGVHFIASVRKIAYLRSVVVLGFAALFLLAAGCGSGSDSISSKTPQAFTVNFAANATSDSTTAFVAFTITQK